MYANPINPCSNVGAPAMLIESLSETGLRRRLRHLDLLVSAARGVNSTTTHRVKSELLAAQRLADSSFN
jgi:hypothetical protein